MIEVPVEDVARRVAHALERNELHTADSLLWPAIDQYPQAYGLWVLAGILLHKHGRLVPSLHAFREAHSICPGAATLVNIGATHRRLGNHDEALEALTTALREAPDSLDALINAGAIWVNEGNPPPGIEYLRRAITLAAGDPQAATSLAEAQWNLALLLLESGEFAEGFDLYHCGVARQRNVRLYSGDAATEPLIYEPGMDRAGKTLIVWGEQGIGDELMFGTVIEDARAEFGEVIFECHPRLQWLHERAHPGLRCFPTRKDDYITWPVTEGIRADYKMPVGDLARLYRRDRESFRAAWAARGPTYSADPAEVARYRERLVSAAGGRPIVGLAMRGGTLLTAREHRTLAPLEARGLIEATGAYFVCLDYEDMSGFASWVHDEVGPGRYECFPAVVATGGDYHHDGALAAACDMVVTVNQSIAHLSAAMGLNVRVLTPKRVAWRYGLTGEEWYWYPTPTVRLYRQGDDCEWGPALDRAADDIRSCAQ